MCIVIVPTHTYLYVYTIMCTKAIIMELSPFSVYLYRHNTQCRVILKLTRSLSTRIYSVGCSWDDFPSPKFGFYTFINLFLEYCVKCKNNYSNYVSCWTLISSLLLFFPARCCQNLQMMGYLHRFVRDICMETAVRFICCHLTLVFNELTQFLRIKIIKKQSPHSLALEEIFKKENF